MSRMVLIVDSATGALIDVAGNSREGGKYSRFSKRMMSLDRNPTLDYGLNGGDSLTVSKGGNKGKEIKLVADTVDVVGDLKVSGDILGAIKPTGNIIGTEGEVLVNEAIDEITGNLTICISLDSSVIDSISGSVKKSDLAVALDGISIDDGDDLDDVKGKFATLLERLNALADQEHSS